MYLVSLVLDIRLNVLTFKLLTSGRHSFAYGSLILLQLPLYLLILILKGKNTVSSLLTLRISGLTLHSWLFFEMYFHEFTLDKLQPKNSTTEINTSFTNMPVKIDTNLDIFDNNSILTANE